MKRNVLISTVLFLFSVLCAAAAFSDETAGQTETPLFTNKDIEKYKGAEDSQKMERNETKDYQAEKKEHLEKVKEEREKEYWCKKASPYRRRIESTRDDIRELENEVSEAQLKSRPGKKEKSLSLRLQNSRKKLKETERDLDELENEAYRKGVPQGWLRCQFE